MQASISEINTLTIIASTTIILFFGALITYYLFKYQRKRHQHQKEMAALRESFSQTLLRSKLEIQEQTLDHISKELHANVSQSASLINIHLAEILDKALPENRESILETKSLAKQLMIELKGISATLNTDYIMKIGFSRALENELNRIAVSMKEPAILSRSGEEFSIGAENEIILFRLCQEVLNNSLRHAEATKLHVSVNYHKEGLELELEDDGIGFDVDFASEGDNEKISTGLMNIHRRAKSIGAQIEIASHINEGTKVNIKVPR